MENIRSYICTAIGKQSVTDPGFNRISVHDVNDMISKIRKDSPKKTQFSSINKFIYDLLNCKDFFPEEPSFCIGDNDCDPGMKCKEGNCLVDPESCINTGCSEPGNQCNQATGDCILIPNCDSNDDCNMIEGGETCIKNVCQKPSICIGGVGVDSCAPTWTCTGGKCVKEDCTIISSDNQFQCCRNDAAFVLNKEACCIFNPGDLRCI